MKYNHILNKTINKYNNVLFKNAILFEGIEDLKRYFPKLNDETLHKLVALDPTYKGGDQLNYWLYKWRQIHYNEPEFTITEPHYGVMGFDDEFWKNGMKHFMEELITILNSNKK